MNDDDDIGEELNRIRQRVLQGLHRIGTFTDLRWDDEGDCIAFYDEESEHDIAVAVHFA